MTKRKTITARMARDIILNQIESGHAQTFNWAEKRYTLTPARASCPLCYEGIMAGDDTIWEHMQAITRDGPDEVENIRLVHKQCAKKKTIGSGATTHGSDIGEIAKTKRLEKGPKEPKGNISSRKDPWPKGRKFR